MNKTRSFEHTPKSVAGARRFAAELLAGIADRDALDAIQLMVSELATNCIRHTDSGFNLTIIRDSGRIRVEATDRGAGEPRKQWPGPTDPSGRGLQIVDVLSTDWGCDHRPDVGKTVWFTIDFRAGSPARDAGAHRLEAQDRRHARAYDTEADFDIGQVAPFRRCRSSHLAPNLRQPRPRDGLDLRALEARFIERPVGGDSGGQELLPSVW